MNRQTDTLTAILCPPTRRQSNYQVTTAVVLHTETWFDSKWQLQPVLPVAAVHKYQTVINNTWRRYAITVALHSNRF